MQRWGFVDDVQEEKGCVAVRFEDPGKDPPYRWVLVERGDRFFVAVNPGPPFHTVTLAIRNNKNTMSRTISMKK